MLVIDAGVVLAGRYRLEDWIAAGGVGEVWRATDSVLGRTVAVKLLRPEFAGHGETLARFRAEARLAARLTHPGIVQVYDFGQAGPRDAPFLVMELVDGPSLADVMDRGPLDPAWVLDLIGQVAAALAAAHAAGLVHRDIKPANLLLAADGTVKITDFGIAHAAGSASLTQVDTVHGTPGYLAPERAVGAQATPASDLYSLGVVAWESLAGGPPFTGTPMEVALAHANRGLPPLPTPVPAGLAALVTEMTERDPGARPASAAVVAARARELRAASMAGATLRMDLPPGERQGADRRQGVDRRRLPRWPAALAIGGIAFGLAVWLATAPSGTAPQQHGTGSRPTASAPAVRMVSVDEAALTGQPADAVFRQLRQSGLQPRLVSEAEGHLSPGTVISVSPAGQVPAGSTVTVTVAVAPPGHGHGHGNGGDGNGDIGPGGGGNGNGGNGN